jgi:hypothetical protein
MMLYFIVVVEGGLQVAMGFFLVFLQYDLSFSGLLNLK